MSTTAPIKRSHHLPTPWTVDDDAYLRSEYMPDRRGHVRTIAEQLGRTVHAVKRRAGLLGLRRPRRQQRWNPDEEQFLQNQAGTLLTATLAKRLNRSVSAVTHKCRQLHLRTRFREGYTLDDLVTCFGASPHTIHRWVHDSKLQIHYRHTSRPHDAWYVTEHAILTFIEQHPLAFDLHRVDQIWFLDLLFDGKIMAHALTTLADDARHSA
jgi:transposase